MVLSILSRRVHNVKEIIYENLSHATGIAKKELSVLHDTIKNDIIDIINQSQNREKSAIRR